MTVERISWELGQSSIDRAGGFLRLSALCRRLVGRRFDFEEAELHGWIGVRLVVRPASRDKVKLAAWDEWIALILADRSVSVREDQRDICAGDLLALEPIIRAEVARLSEDAGIPELELRALYGDR